MKFLDLFAGVGGITKEMATMIKFRTWDKGNEIYLYNVQDAYDTLSGFVKYDDGEDACYDEDCFGGFLDNKRYDVEQFTNLKDKNGNKIYEGDIVKTDQHGYNRPDSYAVKEFIQNVCIFRSAQVTDGSTMFEEATNGHGLTVIGNIHENMELLEVDE